MELVLQRGPNSRQGCQGVLTVDRSFECYTLEPPENMTDSRGVTAVPARRYKVELTWSPKFKRIMPELANVKGREGIRLHWGNYEVCTDGCILTGEDHDAQYDLWNSRAAFDRLFNKLLWAWVLGDDAWLDILPAAPAVEDA